MIGQHNIKKTYIEHEILQQAIKAFKIKIMDAPGFRRITGVAQRCESSLKTTENNTCNYAF